MNQNKVLTNILIEMFGFPRRYSENPIEVDFNCPKCDNGNNKFNLSVNTVNKIFNCWACGYKGKVRKLFYDYGSVDQQSRFTATITRSLSSKLSIGKDRTNSPAEEISLGSFRSLKTAWSDSLHYRAAINYLSSRKIDKNLINTWDLCFADSGKYKDRIIIPSKNAIGGIDYFVARSFYGKKPPYLNPKMDKETLIFGEKFIDWKKPVILTEGVFDAMVVYNSVPILGTNIKHCSRLIRTLIENKSNVILAFDSDAVKKVRQIGNYLLSLGIGVKIIKHDKYNDIAEIYEKAGKSEIIRLLQEAKPFNELEIALWSLK